VALCEQYSMLTEELRCALHARNAIVRRRYTCAADKVEERRELTRQRKQKVTQAFARLSIHIQNCPRCGS